MKIGVVVPSYLDDRDFWIKIVNRFYDSLTYIKKLDNLEFLCNWQNIPEDDIDVMNTIERFNQVSEYNSTWEYKSLMNRDYRPRRSMCCIRNDAMMLDRSCDVYLYVDDDLFYRDEKSYDDLKFVIDEFERDERLGLVMCAGYLGGYNYVDKLRYDSHKYYMTNLGLFLRNINRCPESPIYSKESLDTHQRAFEDVIADFEINKAGYRCATRFNCSVGWTYREEYIINRDITPTNEESIHHPQISLDSLERYIKDDHGFDIHLDKAKDICRVKRKIFPQLN